MEALALGPGQWLHPQMERQVWGLKAGDRSGGRWGGRPAKLCHDPWYSHA